MERIQSAIQKAREARQDQTDIVSAAQSSAPRVPEMDHKSEASVADAVNQRWSELDNIRLSSHQLQKARIVAVEANSQAASFDVLRTRMLHQMNANNWRRVAIASAGAACGKTTLCLNLAFGLARQRSIKVLVIDLDMRRPTIGKLLQPEMDNNFADALEGRSAPEAHLICYEQRLAFATNTKPVANSAELLQDKDAAHVIDDMEARYQPDVMLFDTPPMLACDDTIAFLDQIDCVMLVAAAESTTAEEITKCQREISARSNLMGVVLNKCRYLEKTDSYGY
ncbi:CpsD/CapB family tyrosine-protein kinase [Ruegeria sp. ANG-S4]|uniref:CpsD/CapB family tyrosine-protein kinase n=1 Tax=Ruegeria sp. ANG-S4 TaxID=1577904 RepID=UPI00068EBB86|nr:CpsD/CapB family tyrosine-protein kinase [Ruegeria sp. ANG-S4]